MDCLPFQALVSERERLELPGPSELNLLLWLKLDQKSFRSKSVPRTLMKRKTLDIRFDFQVYVRKTQYLQRSRLRRSC